MRRILAVLIFALLPALALAQSSAPGIPVSRASTVAGTSSVALSSVGSLTGPCDILAAAGTPCIAAHSVTRRMFGNYTGALFQLTRSSDSTTQDIGSLSNGLYNAALVASFCLNTECAFSKIYDEAGNANDLTQATFSLMAPWTLHYFNGLPVVWTTQNSAYYRNLTTTNVPIGATASSTYYVRANNVYACCGDYGRAENPVATPNYACSQLAACPNGSMWELGYMAYNRWSGSTLNNSISFGLDLEYFETTAPLKTTPVVMSLLSKYTPANGSITMKYAASSSTAMTGLAQGAAPTTPVVQNSLRLGEGGDASKGAGQFFEGAVTTGSTTDATDNALQANIAAFYGAQPTPPQTVSDALLTPLAQVPSTAGGLYEMSLADAGLWGLRRMRSGYTGYAALIRRASDSTTQNIGFNSTGDFDDATAQSFCAGTTCTVQTLYTQGLFYGLNIADHSYFDMTQATTANQPSLAFNSLGGRTTMHFSGSQWMCDGGFPSTYGAVAFYAVTRRTGNTSAYNAVLASLVGFLGFNNAANQAYYKSVNAGATPTPALTDSTWASLIGVGNSPSGSATLYVNGTGTSATGSNSVPSTFLCMGSGSTGGTLQLTGDIAELGVSGGAVMSSTQAAALYANESAYYGGQF